MNPKAFASRVAFAGFVALVAMFFALPMLWLVFAPFNGSPTLQARPSRPTLGNFREVFQRDDVLPALLKAAAHVTATRLSGLVPLAWSFLSAKATFYPTPTRRVSFRHQPLTVPLWPKQEER